MTIIKPRYRDNIALNAHPLGCQKNIQNLIQEAEALPPITSKKPIVLIIGGSSGYGLASRILFGFNANAIVYSISFERRAKGKNTGSAGYYNNFFYQHEAQKKGLKTYDYNLDAFSHDTKSEIIDQLKKRHQRVDYVIYSLASGVRIDPDTHVLYQSSLKPCDKPFEGTHVDIMKQTCSLKSLEPATHEELEATRKVMGGEDYLQWIEALMNAECLAEGAQAVSFTYLGSPLTYPIYHHGTIGYAKHDLFEKHCIIKKKMQEISGDAHISSSKTILSKASVFIPTLPLYASALFEVMKRKKLHESTILHKHRLFYGIESSSLQPDNDGYIRLDNHELSDDVQQAVTQLLDNFKGDLTTLAFDAFMKEFNQLNGFDVDGIDYTQHLNLEDY